MQQAFFIVLVVLVSLFPLVDSLVSLNNTNGAGSEGHAVGTLWLWVPAFICGELESALRRADGEVKEYSVQEDNKNAGQKSTSKPITLPSLSRSCGISCSSMTP